MHFRPFPVFWAIFVLSGKSADPNPPPLLVKNSTIFFKPSLMEDFKNKKKLVEYSTKGLTPPPPL